MPHPPANGLRTTIPAKREISASRRREDEKSVLRAVPGTDTAELCTRRLFSDDTRTDQLFSRIPRGKLSGGDAALRRIEHDVGPVGAKVQHPAL